MKKLTALLIMLLSLPLAAAEKVKVVTTFSILADLVQEIGQPHVSVVSLVGPDEDAHVHQPTPNDSRALLEADLIIANGLGFEPWLRRLLSSTQSSARFLEATDGVIPLMIEEDGQPVADPHAWHNLANVEIYASNIARALSEVDPVNAEHYQSRLRDYSQQLHVLLAEVREQLGRLPPSQRRIVTSHDAFNYLGQAYGLRFIAPQGLSTEDEPSAAEVAALIRQIREERVRAVFVENIRDPRLIRNIAEEGGARVGGVLYSDALAAEGEASTLLGMYRHNVHTLMEALGN